MDKNTVWAVVLSTVVLIVFMFLQMAFFPPSAAGTTTAEDSGAAVSDIVPQNSDSFVSADVVSDDKENSEERNYVIETDTVKVTFTNRGGDVVGYELLDHRDGNHGVEMADNISAENRAFALSFGTQKESIINDVFTVRQPDDRTIIFYKKFRSKNASGNDSEFTLAKRYSFHDGDYMFKLDIMVSGEDGFTSLSSGNSAYTLRTPPQIGPYYNAKNDRYEHRTFMSFTDGRKKKQMLSPGQTKIYEKQYSWTGIAGKYFTVLVAPVAPEYMQSVTYSAEVQVEDYANAQLFLPRRAITDKETTDTYYIYVGPRTENSLSIYNNASDNSWSVSSLRLNDSMESSGILFWLEAILKWCMELLYRLIPNWGVSIIILTVIIKVLFFPLTKQSSVASLKMQEVQPRMQELQNKYKDDPTRLNMEISKLYKEMGYNPLSGCLPLLIQFPLIFAMYNLFNNYFEFRGAMFIPGWIPDLSVGDSIYTFGFNLPFIGNQLRLLPIIYVISQLLFGWITQSAAAANSQMKIMMYGMPLFFFFIFYNAPSGLLIYWTVSNLLQLVQQVIINRIMKTKRAEMEQKKPAVEKFVPQKRKRK